MEIFEAFGLFGALNNQHLTKNWMLKGKSDGMLGPHADY
jgi:hypothetical protein